MIKQSIHQQDITGYMFINPEDGWKIDRKPGFASRSKNFWPRNPHSFGESHIWKLAYPDRTNTGRQIYNQQNKQRNRQTNTQTNNQPTNQPTKQTNKQHICTKLYKHKQTVWVYRRLYQISLHDESKDPLYMPIIPSFHRKPCVHHSAEINLDTWTHHLDHINVTMVYGIYNELLGRI